MTTKKLQQRQAEYDKDYWGHEDFSTFENIRHLTLHVGKILGKLSTYCEARERERGYPDDQLKNEVIPDMFSAALQLSNWLGEDLSSIHARRLKSNKKILDSEKEKRQKYHDSLPKTVKEYGFDFYWDNTKVWKVRAPVTEAALSELEWHFDIPFLWEGEGKYNLKARDVLNHPHDHREEYDRMLRANLDYPIDVMENKGRLTILDGLHRLMKASMNGYTHVRVRVIPRRFIQDIL